MRQRQMISVVIPTLNAQSTLPLCLQALVPAVVHGVVGDVLVVDGGSTDHTTTVAHEAGATLVSSAPGRGIQLAKGAKSARGSWLLFLHADTVLEAGWDIEAQNFIDNIESGRRRSRAAAFSFALDDDGIAPRILEKMVWVRAGVFGFPYGDQGLLISRQTFDEVGGYRAVEIMEDIDIVRRLGRRRLTILRSRAITGATRYRKDGYICRVLRNQTCLFMYLAGCSLTTVKRFYCRKPPNP